MIDGESLNYVDVRIGESSLSIFSRRVRRASSLSLSLLTKRTKVEADGDERRTDKCTYGRTEISPGVLHDIVTFGDAAQKLEEEQKLVQLHKLVKIYRKSRNQRHSAI